MNSAEGGTAGGDTGGQGAPEPPRAPWLIALFTRHRTAANLLMVLMIIAGLFSLTRMNTQFFPDFGIDIVVVSVAWPGASASDVDQNIVQAIEPEVRFLEGVKAVRPVSAEGQASIVIEFEPGTNMQEALSEVETAVARITTLPEDSEKPVIQRIARFDTVSRIVLSGPYSEAALKAFVKRIRDDLLKRGIDKVTIIGARKEEIWIDVRPEVLRQLNLTLGDIAAVIRAQSQDVPSGDLRGRSRRQIRSIGKLTTAREIGQVEIKSLKDGRKVILRDVATVTERFEDRGITVRVNGQRAIELFIGRSPTGDALGIADKVDAYFAELRRQLPPQLKVVQYDKQSDLIRSRISLLLENGITGLILVLIVLFVFLNFGVAFWVAVGIPVSLLATMLVMWWTGQTINMVSLFGIIMALGIIVDDAIVVGEHSEALHRRGYSPMQAAEGGGGRMAAPVFSASLTTIATFLPLLLITGIIGQIIQAIPLVVIAVLVASLIECFLVLPGHMREALNSAKGIWYLAFTPFRAWRRIFDKRFDRFRDTTFRRMVRFSLRWRYATVALALATFIGAFGAVVIAKRVPFVFFPNPEVDNILVNVEFTAGTPRARTVAMIDELERSMRAAELKLAGKRGALIKIAVARVGSSIGRQFGASVDGDHAGSLIVQMIPTERRTIKASEFVAAWRKEVRRLPGIELLTIAPARGGPPGRDIDVRLTGPDPAKLKAASNEIKRLIRAVPGTSDVEDDLPWGKQEVILELTPRGRALGFTTESVGRQVRHAFEGAIAKRFAREDEEVVIRVQFPRREVDSAALNNLYIKSPTGAFVPLESVVTFRTKTGFASIRRENGQLTVAIVGDLNKGLITTPELNEQLLRRGLKKIAANYGVTTSFEGKAEEQERTLGDILTGMILGLCIIYIVLAWVFSSYFRPIVVMAVIPMGFVGMTIGHVVLGYDLTILSIISLVGLSGIVVNDSIILVTTIKERLDRGEPVQTAIADGSCDRLRAVILTSLTTVGGLTPLLFETDLQAQFLIPMAITLVFGLAYATMLVLFVIPSLIGIQHDIGNLARRINNAINRFFGVAPIRAAE